MSPAQVREAQAKAQNLIAQVEAIVNQLRDSDEACAEAAGKRLEEATNEQLAMSAIHEDVGHLNDQLKTALNCH
jgi:hypothetical protein